MATTAERAAQLREQFANKTRESGEAYITAEGPALELVQAVHMRVFDGLLPNDWVFDKCAGILEALGDGSDADEIPDSLVDVYTSDLVEWAQVAAFRGWIDSAMSEIHCHELDSAIRSGQWSALLAMSSVISAALEESAAQEA